MYTELREAVRRERDVKVWRGRALSAEGIADTDRDNRGSATVEMAVIAPIIAVILILLIYIGLYVYDRSVIYGDAYLAAFSAVQSGEQDNEYRYRQAGKSFAEAAERHMIALGDVPRTVRADEKGVSIRYSAVMTVPIAEGGAELFGLQKGFSFEEEVSAAKHLPVTFIRRCRMLMKLKPGG